MVVVVEGPPRCERATTTAIAIAFGVSCPDYIRRRGDEIADHEEARRLFLMRFRARRIFVSDRGVPEETSRRQVKVCGPRACGRPERSYVYRLWHQRGPGVELPDLREGSEHRRDCAE